MKVLKFGGTSLATADRFRRVADIILREDAEIVVVSAPGKRDKSDRKITDLLFDCYDARLKSGRCDIPFFAVEQRIKQLADGLGVAGIAPYLDQIRHDINSGASVHYTVSRGEFISALILRHILGCGFSDAKELIAFDMEGLLDFSLSRQKIKSRLAGFRRVVIPGYYGALPSGEIMTFSRGGSDVSAAVIAAAVGAQVYQNWTDVNGVYFCPLTEICHVVGRLSLRDMRQIAYLGAEVLHPDSLLPLVRQNIPLEIKNTFNPTAKGTIITDDFTEKDAKTVDNFTEEKVQITDNPTAKDSVITDDLTEKDAKTVGLRGDFVPQIGGGACGGHLGAPVAVSGKGGYKLFSFYCAGSCENNYIHTLMDSCRKKGAKIFATFCGVDTFDIVLRGEIGDIKGCVKSQNVALITLAQGNKKEVVGAVCTIDLPLVIIQSAPAGAIIAVDESLLKPWLTALCRLFCRDNKATIGLENPQNPS